MKLPDIPAIAIGAVGLLCLTQNVELPNFITQLADNEFIASCVANLANYSTVSTVCMYVALVAFLVAGILRIWLDADYARYIWAAGSVALSVLLMILLNNALFSWAWTCDLYDAGTTEVVLTVFHFCWLFICPFATLYAAMAMSNDLQIDLPDALCSIAMPFWIIPACAVVGFAASLIPYAALLIVLIPLNYVFKVVDAIFIVLAFIVIFLLLKFGVI